MRVQGSQRWRDPGNTHAYKYPPTLVSNPGGLYPRRNGLPKIGQLYKD